MYTSYKIYHYKCDEKLIDIFVNYVMLANGQHTLCYCDNNNDKYVSIYNGGYNSIYTYILELIE